MSLSTTDEDIKDLIDLALLTEDKEWFNELLDKIKSTTHRD